MTEWQEEARLPCVRGRAFFCEWTPASERACVILSGAKGAGHATAAGRPDPNPECEDSPR